MTDRFAHLRLIEALLFSSAAPLGRAQLARHLPEDANLDEIMEELSNLYANRGVNLVNLGARWAFRSAPDLAPLMQIETKSERKPTRAAIETLAIIAYHQPMTRGEIEEVRGVALSRGTLDTLLEAGWIKPKGRRKTPGKPVTWGTTEAFLDHFSLESLESLPGVAELKAAGLIDTRPAVTAIGGRGRLLDPGEAGEDVEREAQNEDGEELDLAEALAADFGADLLAEREHPDTGDSEDDDPGTQAAARHDIDLEAGNREGESGLAARQYAGPAER